jgi:hypothetical protein
MKSKLFLGISMLLLAAGTVFMACQSATGGSPSSAPSSVATLSGVTVASVAATLGTPASTWNAAGLAAGKVVLTTAAQLSAAAVAVTKGDAGESVYFGSATGTAAPAFGTTSGTSTAITFNANDYLYVKVVAADTATTLIYKIQVQVQQAAKSNVATLSAISVAGQAATLGTPGATYNAAAIAAGAVSLASAQATGAAIVATPTNANASIQYAQVTGSGAPTFGTTASFTFANGDYLYIQVISQDSSATEVYKVVVSVGTDATVTAITVGGVSLAPSNSYIPSPGATPAAAGDGGAVYITSVSSSPLTVAATPKDSGATVQYAYSAGQNGSTSALSFSGTASYTFADDDLIYVKVTSANGVNTNYYKVTVAYPRTVTLQHGSPAILSDSVTVTDPAWASATPLPIDRIWTGDSTAPFIASPKITAKGYALWDANGIYVRVVVTTNRAVSVGSTSNPYLYDSVETFLNETYTAGNTGDYSSTTGGQYRVTADNQTSGDPSSAPTALGSMHNAWLTYDSSNNPTGYVVEMQAPFVSSPKPASGATIGFELQLNCAATGGTRDGVMAWNDILNTNYENIANYGTATLSP